MNRIGHITNCCGCKACLAACHIGAISFRKDKEGFEYPIVSDDICIGCGKCEQVCPALSIGDERSPLIDYAAFCPDDTIRLASSSGGIFYEIAQCVILHGGVVFGAAFTDDFTVKHIAIDNGNDLHLLQGSKYLQSDTGNTFQQCESYLNSGQHVLYSGTPCQISGLKHYLKKDYENLLTIDIICHGVPSPEVWKCYLKRRARNQRDIKKVSFRDKSFGWHNFSLRIDNSADCWNETHRKDPYMQLFLQNIILRPSCYNCPAKGGRSGSDITLADFWGVERILPELDDPKGISLVLANTEKGISFIDGINCTRIKVDHNTAISYNKSWHSSVSAHPKRKQFFKNYKRWRNFNHAAIRLLDTRPNICIRAFRLAKNHIVRLLR